MTERAYIPWVVLGSGRLGTTIAHLAPRLGVELRAVWSRSGCPKGLPKTTELHGGIESTFEYLGGSIVWITVADEAIPEVAAAVSRHLRPADIVVHCSGLLDSRVLRNAGILGPVASIHPLLSIAEPRKSIERLSTCAWTVEGDFPAVAFAKWMLGKIGVDPIEIEPENKVLYHASAVTAAGLLDALMDVAFSFADAGGFSSEQSRALLLPLARSILENLETRNTASSLTGPVARGDEEVIARHIEAIAATGDASALEVYKVLTQRARLLRDDPH